MFFMLELLSRSLFRLYFVERYDTIAVQLIEYLKGRRLRNIGKYSVYLVPRLTDVSIDLRDNSLGEKNNIIGVTKVYKINSQVYKNTMNFVFQLKY